MQFFAVYLIPEASSLVTGDISSALFAKLYNDHVAVVERLLEERVGAREWSRVIYESRWMSCNVC